MSNTNSIIGWAQTGSVRNTFAAQTIASTTETELVVQTDTGTTQAFLVLPTGGQVYGASSGLDVNANPAVTDRSNYLYGLPSGESNDQFNSSSWDGREFKIRLTGIGNAGANASQSVIINLYQGTSTTVGSNTKIATTGSALAMVAGGAFNFAIEFTGLWDATSQILSGYYTSNIAFASTSQFTTTTVITNVCTSITAAKLSFIPTIVLGNGASSTVTLREFVAERV